MGEENKEARKAKNGTVSDAQPNLHSSPSVPGNEASTSSST